MPLASVNPNKQFPRLSPLEGRVETSEFVSLSMQAALYDSPMWATQRAATLLGSSFTNEYNPLLSPEQANEKYGIEDDGVGDGGVKFTKPISAQKAFLINNYKLEERKRNERLAKGSDSAGRVALGFTTGIGSQFIDPVNLGLNFLFPGIGAERTLAIAARYGKTAARVTQTASGVAVGMVAAEPFSYMSQVMGEQNNYGLKDSAINFAAGMVLGTGINLTLGAISDGLSRSAKVLGEMPPEMTKRVLGEAIANLHTGKPVNPVKSAKSDALSRFKQGMEQADRNLQLDEAVGEGIKVEVDDATQIAIKFHDKKTAPASLLRSGTDNLTLAYGKTKISVATGNKDVIVIDTKELGQPEELQAMLWQIFKEVGEHNESGAKELAVYVNGHRYDSNAIYRITNGVDAPDVLGGRVIDKPGTPKEVIQYAEEDTVIEGIPVKKGEIAMRTMVEDGRIKGQLSEHEAKRAASIQRVSEEIQATKPKHYEFDSTGRVTSKDKPEVGHIEEKKLFSSGGALLGASKYIYDGNRFVPYTEPKVEAPAAPKLEVPEEIDGPQVLGGKQVLSMEELEETMDGFKRAYTDRLTNDFIEEDLDTDGIMEAVEEFTTLPNQLVTDMLKEQGISDDIIQEVLGEVNHNNIKNEFEVYDLVADCILRGGK